MKKYLKIMPSLLLAALAVMVHAGCDDEPADVPADDPERELAEQELEAERQAQEQNRQVREGLQNSANSLKEEAGGDGVANMAGGQDEYERKREERLQASRDAKAKAAGFDSWDAYERSLNEGGGTTRPN